MFTHQETPSKATARSTLGLSFASPSSVGTLHIGEESLQKKSKASRLAHRELVPEALRSTVGPFDVDALGSGVAWAVHDQEVYCWDATGREVRVLAAPPSHFDVVSGLVAPSGQLALGPTARRWLVVTSEACAYLYGAGSGAEASVPEAQLQLVMPELDSPWRLCSGHAGLVSDRRDNLLNQCWALCTRDGNVLEIFADQHSDAAPTELHYRMLCGVAPKPRSLWGSLVSSLWRSARVPGSETALQSHSPFLIACSVTGGVWLVVDEENMVTALPMRDVSEPPLAPAWHSSALQSSGGAVLDSVFDFRCRQWFVLRQGQSFVSVYGLTSDGRGLTPLQRQPLGATATVTSRLLLSGAAVGTVSLVDTATSSANATASAAAAAAATTTDDVHSQSHVTTLQTSFADVGDVSVVAGDVSMSQVFPSGVPLSVERVEELSHELAGSLLNDHWLEWAEKVNDAPLNMVGKVMRTRLAKHQALLANHPRNKVVRENNEALLAVHGLYGCWAELMASGETECQTALRNDLVAVLGATIPSSSSRRLSARSIPIFNMLWSCCPLVGHVLSSGLRRYASGHQLRAAQHWALRLLIAATLPLAQGFDQVDSGSARAEEGATSAYIKPDAILAFLRSDSFASFGVDGRVATLLAVAAVVAAKDADDKTVALALLGRYGPPALHRRVCEEQALPLPLVLLAVQDFLQPPPGTGARDTLLRFLVQYGAAFETCLWRALIAEHRYGVVLDIANDQDLLGASLFAHLAAFPNAQLFGLHSLQCQRYSECAAALVAQSQGERLVLPRKQTLASLATLASLCQPLGHVPEAVQRELVFAKAAALIRYTGPLTRDSLVQYVLDTLPRTEHDPHLLVVAALDAADDDESRARLWRAAYARDDWAGHLGAQLDQSMVASDSSQAAWCRRTCLAQLLRAIPGERWPSAAEFAAMVAAGQADEAQQRLATSSFYAAASSAE